MYLPLLAIIPKNFRLSESEVLRYYRFPETPRGNEIVRKYFDRWRLRNRIHSRCDIPGCTFHNNDLEWNDKPLILFLDHKYGFTNNCLHENLRLVCPNCNSQLDTTGARNINRIQNKVSHGYEVVHRNGSRDAKIHIEGAQLTGKGTVVSTSTGDN